MGWVGSFAGIENTASIVAGCAMLLTGIAMLGFIPGFRAWSGFSLPARLLRPLGKLISSTSPGAKFTLGIMMGFLPCGMIYAALMKAIGEATPLGGALVMFAFCIGTSVSLIVVGLGASAITRKVARWGTPIAAVMVLVMGTLLIVRGAGAGPINHNHLHHMMNM